MGYERYKLYVYLEFIVGFYVYILKCSDGSYYTGHTDDIEKRLSEHVMGKVKCYTQKRLLRPSLLKLRRDYAQGERKNKLYLIQAQIKYFTLKLMTLCGCSGYRLAIIVIFCSIKLKPV